MRWLLMFLSVLCVAGCQITAADLLPFELRKGGGETEKTEPQPKPQPEPRPPEKTGKDHIFVLGITGMD